MLRKIVFMSILLMLTLAGNAQNDSVAVYLRNIPQLSAEPEVLDWDSFPGITCEWEEFDCGNEWRFRQVDTINKGGHKIIITYYCNGEKIYKEYDANGMLIKYYGFYPERNRYVPSRVSGCEWLNPYIYIEKDFYSNNMIKEKALRTVFGFSIGKYYEYDENGNLRRTIDRDNGYDFTAEDIVNYCIRNKIDVCTRRQDSFEKTLTDIKKTRINGEKMWIIQYRFPVEKDGYDYINIVLHLDGKTGQVFSRGAGLVRSHND